MCTIVSLHIMTLKFTAMRVYVRACMRVRVSVTGGQQKPFDLESNAGLSLD